MKKLILISALTLFAAHMSSAQPRYEGVVRLDNSLLYEEGDSLKVQFTVQVDRQTALRAEAMLLTPVLSDSRTLVALPDLMMLGRNKNRSYERAIHKIGRRERENFERPALEISVSELTDTLIRYDHTMLYEPWMDDARLAFYVETIDYRNQRTLLAIAGPGHVKLSARTPYEVQPTGSYIAPERESKSRRKQGSAFLDFQAGKSTIIPTYRRNPEELAKIREAFQEVQDDPNITITALFIEGFASIEGQAAKNEVLARDRSYALRDYIVSNFNLPLSEEQIRVSWVGEDWEGLREMVEQSTLPQKEQILKVIDETPVADGRENALMRLAGGAPYRTMLRDMFPLSRRVEYQIDYSVKDFSVEEARSLVGKRAETLSHLELYNLAKSYGEGTKEHNDILINLIPRYYPDDAVAAINAAAVMIRTGEYATARRLLEKVSEHPQALGNLGAIELALGNLDQAEALLKKAAAAGVTEAEANLVELEKKRADNLRMERYKNR